MQGFKFGPAGGIGTAPSPVPKPFDAPPEDNEKITTIEGRAAEAIDQIEVIWRNTLTGQVRSSPEFGGDGGEAFSFRIDGDDCLTNLSGWTGYQNLKFPDGTFREFHVVRGLQLKTLGGSESEVFGETTDFPFFYECPPGFQIVGLFGRMGDLIDQLGVYIQSIQGVQSIPRG